MLQYEKFVNDFNVIFDAVEQFFDIRIHQEKRQVISDRYHIDKIQKEVADKNSFNEYDAITHWHGKHISQYKGRPYYYKTFFSREQVRYLENVYHKYLLELNYINNAIHLQ